jgi:hypothetical protein
MKRLCLIALTLLTLYVSSFTLGAISVVFFNPYFYYIGVFLEVICFFIIVNIKDKDNENK